MARVRVYELARELGVETKDMVGLLAGLGLSMKSHSSSVDQATAQAIKELVRERRRKARHEQQAEEAAAAPVEAPAPPAAPEATPAEAVRPKPTIVEGAKAAPAAPEPSAAKPPVDKEKPRIVRRVQPPAAPAEPVMRVPARRPTPPSAGARPSAPTPRMRPVAPPPPRPQPRRAQAPSRRRPVPAVVEQPVAVAEQPVVDRGELVVAGGMTVREFAARLGLRGEEAVSELVGLGVFKSLNEMLTVAEMAPLGARHGYRVRLEEEKAEERPAVVEAGPAPRAPDVKYVSVPPVVAVLGHVDHGKTSLLDYIRRTDVTAREHGGITQHIGASEVERDGKRIVFIDTPGHEAFTQLRARGAQVTDLALLLVAADDGVMPQTLEALQHARAAGVPIIVVVNKIDLEGGDPQRVRRQLGEQGLVPEEWGGETIFVDVSAKNGQGVDTLLDMILLLAEMRELKAPINVPGAGIVIESALDPARGPLASVLVKEGRLRKGDVIVCGTTCGRVRRMTDWLGSEVPAAAPAKPVELCGLTDVPRAGSRIEVVTDPRQAKALARYLAEQRKQETAARLRAAPMLVETAPGRKELLVVLKADAQGSLEAVTHAVERLGTEEVKARFIYQGIGNVAESDVMLAGAGQALVLGFNVRADAAAQRLAKQEGVVVLLYSIIYELTEAVHASLEGLLEPEYREVLIGRVEVRRLFFSARSGTIAGCYVLEGRAVRGGIVHVTRNGEVVYSGPLTSLRHLKDDVRQMEQGFECGIVLDGFNDFQEGDVVEVYEREQVARTLR